MRTALSLAILVFASGEASAQTTAAARKAAKELVEYLQTRFAREVAEEGAEKLEGRFAKAITKYGDDTAAAARKLGPRIALDGVQRHGADGAKILARFGDKGWRMMTANGPGTMQVYKNLGNEGVELMIRRHGEITAARLPDLAPAMKASGKSKELLAVLERYGDRACSFIWRNKGTIFGAAALTAFLANPKPYLDGLLTVAEAPMEQIASRTDWTTVILMATVLIAGIAALRMLVFRRPGMTRTAHEAA